MSAEIIPFPTWDKARQSIDTEADMIGWAVKTLTVEQGRLTGPEAVEFGRSLWRTMQDRVPAVDIQEKRKQLECAIGRACSGWIFTGNGSTGRIKNFLRVRYSVRSSDDIPAEKLQEAIDIVNAMGIASNEFYGCIYEIKRAFEKRVFGGGAPWTPGIKRKLKRELGDNPDWRVLADEVLTSLS